jgi:glycosyltransferase involved in cell wall biosynthesis
VSQQEEDMVGVVVPMLNAERTIAATLDSICRQTYAKLDIVVVDDGSTDSSVAIVDGKIRQDRRVRIIRQSNAGVAAARNAGAVATAAAFLAFVDADDLWAPTKIEFQLDALKRGGPQVGLVYCWFASIDQSDRVVSFGPQPLFDGDTMAAMCESNWIGNGSSLLVRRSAFNKAGGYDTALRAQGAQGAEDLLICFRIAEHFTFAVVPRYLVGYRVRPDSMSHDAV